MNPISINGPAEEDAVLPMPGPAKITGAVPVGKNKGDPKQKSDQENAEEGEQDNEDIDIEEVADNDEEGVTGVAGQTLAAELLETQQGQKLSEAEAAAEQSVKGDEMTQELKIEQMIQAKETPWYVSGNGDSMGSAVPPDSSDFGGDKKFPPVPPAWNGV